MSRSKKKNSARPKPVALRAVDQETTRVVAFLGDQGEFVGAGCLVDGENILTCYHVVQAALGDKPKNKLKRGARVRVRLVGIPGDKPIHAKVKRSAKLTGKLRLPIEDLVLLELENKMDIPAAEFASPLRHCGKRYSVLGFPDGDRQGRHASGVLHAMDAAGLVQMDGSSSLFVKGGFSGAPVWSPDLGAFVGLVVTELDDARVAWCIPSRVLCSFFPKLLVRFRMPLVDRPIVHDYRADDPNAEIFGTISKNWGRCLTATVKWQKKKERYVAKAKYQRLPGSEPPRGGFVTFITYPDFKNRREDSYELFAKMKNGSAEVKFYPWASFTIAAIGDAGDTTLTLNLANVPDKPDHFK